MKLLPDWIKNGYLRLIDPVANWLVKRGVHPNTITIVGTLCTVVGGIIYATGHIRTGGFFLGITALFDVLDGTVARRSNKSSMFGAFLDSTLDRLGDGAIFGGLVLYFAGPGDSELYMVLALACLVLGSLTSYARAKAEGLGFNATVGIAERADRLVA